MTPSEPFTVATPPPVIEPSPKSAMSSVNVPLQLRTAPLATPAMPRNKSPVENTMSNLRMVLLRQGLGAARAAHPLAA